jgi:hypothetical protein
MPLTGDVVLRAGFAEAYGTLSVTSDFTLVAPVIEVPSLTLPPIDVPTLTLPPIDVPTLTLPPIEVPTLTLPPIEAPTLTLPPIEVPTLTLPPIEVPTLTLPPIEVPTLTLPPIEVPTLTLPPIDVPTIEVPTIALTFPPILAISARPTVEGQTEEPTAAPTFEVTVPATLQSLILSFDCILHLADYRDDVNNVIKDLEERVEHTVEDTVSHTLNLLNDTCELVNTKKLNTTEVEYTVRTQIHVVDFPEFNGNYTQLYNKLVDEMKLAQMTGILDVTLQHYAKTYNATCLNDADVKTVTFTEPEVSDANDNNGAVRGMHGGGMLSSLIAIMSTLLLFGFVSL